MRILVKRRVVVLSAAETKLWENGGPEGYEFRSATRRAVRSRAVLAGKPYEIYVSKSAGHRLAAQIAPETHS